MARSTAIASFVLLLVLALLVSREPQSPHHPGNIAGFSAVHVVPGARIVPDLQQPYRRAAGHAFVSGLTPRESPSIVLVVALNGDFRRSYLKRLLQERTEYADIHGYGIFARFIQDFVPMSGEPLTQEATRAGQLKLIRQALEAFPHADWLWYVDDHSRILNKSVGLEWSANVDDVRLKREVIVNTRHIRTASRLPPSGVSLVFSQTDQGLNAKSVLLAVSDTTKAIVEYVADPINCEFASFQSAPDPLAMLMCHLFAWHPVILRHTALVPSQLLGNPDTCERGDFVCHFGSSTHWSELDRFLN